MGETIVEAVAAISKSYREKRKAEAAEVTAPLPKVAPTQKSISTSNQPL